MSYFADFPLAYYNFGDNEPPVLFQNLTTYLDLIDQIKDDASVYETYTILDGERPDTLSYKIYGDVAYHWTFFLMNEKLRVGGWPLTIQTLDEVIKQNYPHWTITTKANISDSFFVPGSTIQGNNSGTTGEIVEVNLELGQMVVNTIGYETRRTSEDLDEYPTFQLQQEAETGFYYLDLSDIPPWGTGYRINSVVAVYTEDPTENLLVPKTNYLPRFNLKGNKLYLKVDATPFTVPLYVDFFYQYLTNRNFNPTEFVTLTNVDTPELASVQLVSAVAQYNSVHHYEDTDGNYFDVDPLQRNISGLIPITHYNRVEARNEDLKQIRIIKPDSVNQVLSQFKRFLKG